MGERAAIEVAFTLEFKRNLRQLVRRYRSIRQDVQPLLDDLQRGGQPGDRVRGTDAVVFKVRLANRDAQRGKSGGYRVVYYVQTDERVILLTIYSKSDQGDVSAAALRQIIETAP